MGGSSIRDVPHGPRPGATPTSAPTHPEAPPVTPETSPPDPAVVLDLLEAFRRSKVMFAAVSLGIFDALEDGPRPAAELAEALSLHPDALARLLDAAVGLKLLERRGDAYANTPAASAYLCKRSPSRLTGYINYSNDRAVEALGQPRGRRPGGDAPLEADVRLGRPDLLQLLPHRGRQARVPDGDARLRADELAEGRGGLRPGPVPPAGGPGRGDRPPGDRRLPALPGLRAVGLRPARGRAAGPGDRRGLAGRGSHRRHRRRLLRRRAARGRPVRPGPHPARLVGGQDASPC